MRYKLDRWVVERKLQLSPTYWRVLRSIDLLRFYASRWWYFRRTGSKEFSAGVRVIASLGSAILRDVLVAVAAFLLLRLLQSESIVLFGEWLAARASVSVLIVLVADAIAWIGTALADDGRQALESLSGTVAQLSATFIGLYFTSLGLLASTSYKEVSSALRGIVVQERAGRVYLGLVAFAAAFALCELAAIALHVRVGPVDAMFVALCGVVATLSFVVLSVRAFDFFNPAAVASILCQRVLAAALDATPEGPMWREASFQARHRGEAEQSLALLEELLRVQRSATSAKDLFGRVGSTVAGTLTRYRVVRTQIPAESLWFERRPRHPSWLVDVDTTTMDMVARTGGGAPPTLEAAPLWLEERLLGLLAETIEASIASGQMEGVPPVLDALNVYGVHVVNDFDVQAVKALRRSVRRIREAFVATPAGSGIARRQRLECLDLVLLFLPTAIAQMGKASEEVTGEMVSRIASSSTALREQRVDGGVLPADVRRVLASLNKTLQFERDVEGKRLTPGWFLQHHIARAWSDAIEETLVELARITESELDLAVRLADEAKDSQAVVLTIQRARESVAKLQFHSDRVSGALARLARCAVLLEGGRWPQRDVASLISQVVQAERRLAPAIARATVRLPGAAPDGGLPDVTGYAFIALGNELMECLLRRDDELYGQLFPAYALLGQRCYWRAQNELRGQGARRAAALTSDVLLDVLEISGYAYVETHVRGGGFWKATEEGWNSLLAASPQPDSIRRLCGMAVEVRSQVAALSALAIRRTGWSQRYARTLQIDGFGRDGAYGRSRAGVRAVPIDPLAEAFVRQGFIGEHSRTVFLLAYMLSASQSYTGPVPSEVERLEKAVERIRSRRLEGVDD